MKRRLFYLLFPVSIMLSIGAPVMWVRSYWAQIQ
jgi:hypothetical protein